jgi:leucyl/phenylalanyl-tRNA---protein transferase
MTDSTPAVRDHAAVWESLDLSRAPADGPVAFGHDLSPASLLAAYRHGVYPFPAETIEHRLINELTYEADVRSGRVRLLPGDGDPYAIAWCSPDPRPLIPTEQAHLPRSLRQQLRNKVDWTTTVDFCFQRVVLRCRTGRAERWLTDELVAGLNALHERGHAHSVEVWDGDELVAGTFGVHLGAVFSADSQFTVRSGAAKVAIADLARRFAEIGGQAIDVQHDGDHVRSLGAHAMPRARYLQLLRAQVEPKAIHTGPLPARRLAERPEGTSR